MDSRENGRGQVWTIEIYIWAQRTEGGAGVFPAALKANTTLQGTYRKGIIAVEMNPLKRLTETKFSRFSSE